MQFLVLLYKQLDIIFQGETKATIEMRKLQDRVLGLFNKGLLIKGLFIKSVIGLMKRILAYIEAGSMKIIIA